MICGLMISSGIVNAFVIDQKSYRGTTFRKRRNAKSILPYFALSRGPVFHRRSIKTDPYALRDAAYDTLNYIKLHEKNCRALVNPPEFSREMMSLRKTKQTLQFIAKTIEQDIKKKRPYRILNPYFIKKNFGFIKWSGDKKAAAKRGVRLKKDAIRLTKYTVYRYKGSYKKQGEYNCALYSICDGVNIPSYTKSEVIAGAVDNHEKVKPLVWLTREGLEEALMQGAVFVHMTDGKVRAFRVHRNNGITFNKNMKSRKTQERYWYFKEVSSVNSTLKRYNNRQEVLFAGDIRSIGIGKIIAIEYTNRRTKKKELRFGVLADEGAAFKNNLYQLDFFVGISGNKKDLRRRIRKYPERVQAYVIYKKGSYHA